jgi:hypothetical protein
LTRVRHPLWMRLVRYLNETQTRKGSHPSFVEVARSAILEAERSP